MTPLVKKALVLMFLCAAAVMAVLGLASDRKNETVFRTTKEATATNHAPASVTTSASLIAPGVAAGEQPNAEPPKADAPVTAKHQPYTVHMSPMGDVRFDHIPLRVVTLDANYNDMLVSLGEGSKLIATGYKGNFYDGFYEKLGIKAHFDPAHLTFLSSGGGSAIDKELFYQLHADVHHIDPVQLATSRGWSKADVDEIARNVGPFFANRFSRDNSYGGKEPYQYYSLWELAEKVGEVYQRPETIAQLKAVYDEMIDKINRRLPPPEKRPSVGLIFYSNGKFTTYSIGDGGFGQAQYRDVGARDAFASIAARTYKGESGAPASMDIEGLLALNPDVLIMPFAIYPATQASTTRANYEQLLKLKDDPLAQRLTAFRNGRIFPGGTPLQGPVFYLFQIEMAAKQIYPDIFGPYRDDQNYPLSEQMFDRNRVAEILKNANRHAQ
ncbi:MAG: ABC transporter substrate-binding protein [Terracidiphilus sp.]|nr:ABC transporter substrate-binding protein [Terracidiphilus sp.]MDR3799097.1 ABC transporter substrate-binding protein [Terracidiphilus sp.]